MLENIKIKWPFKLEKDFTSAFLKEFNKTWWSFKISDLLRTLKPFDFFWVNKNWVYFCEVKVIEKDIFELSQLRNNQFTSLFRISEIIEKYNLQNINSIILIYSKEFNDYQIISFDSIIKLYNNNWKKIKLQF